MIAKIAMTAADGGCDDAHTTASNNPASMPRITEPFYRPVDTNAFSRNSEASRV